MIHQYRKNIRMYQQGKGNDFAVPAHIQGLVDSAALQWAAEYGIRATFITETLGSGSGTQAGRDHLANTADVALKDKVAHEQQFLPPVLTEEALAGRGKTFFYKENGRPFAWAYQLKGMFKEQTEALRKTGGSRYYAEELPFDYKGYLTQLFHVGPEKVFFTIPEGGSIGECPRSLRAQPYNRPAIVTLTDSETLPPGTTLDFTVKLLTHDLEPVLFECLNLGEYLGFSQWRGAGKGRFNYEITSFKRVDPKDMKIKATAKAARVLAKLQKKTEEAETAKVGKKKFA